MTSGKIVYVASTDNLITGGKRNIYRHVETLVRHGFNACVAAMNDRPPDWLEGSTAPVWDMRTARRNDLTRSDWMVLAEDMPPILDNCRGHPARKILFCQSRYLYPRGLRGARDFSAYGIERTIAASDSIAELLRQRFPGQPVTTVPCWVAPETFRPRPKRLQVCFAPRRRPLEVDIIKDWLTYRHPDLADTAWVQLSGLHERAVAAIMGESAVLLSCNRLEGLGLMPLEAMAAGALVVGYTGIGGREYASPDNGLWWDDEDPIPVAELLAQALTWWRTDAPEAAAMRAAGQATVARYSRESFERALVEFWRAMP